MREQSLARRARRAHIAQAGKIRVTRLMEGDDA
jgi:hypothetical protein